MAHMVRGVVVEKTFLPARESNRSNKPLTAHFPHAHFHENPPRAGSSRCCQTRSVAPCSAGRPGWAAEALTARGERWAVSGAHHFRRSHFHSLPESEKLKPVGKTNMRDTAARSSQRALSGQAHPCAGFMQLLRETGDPASWRPPCATLSPWAVVPCQTSHPPLATIILVPNSRDLGVINGLGLLKTMLLQRILSQVLKSQFRVGINTSSV